MQAEVMKDMDLDGGIMAELEREISRFDLTDTTSRAVMADVYEEYNQHLKAKMIRAPYMAAQEFDMLIEISVKLSPTVDLIMTLIPNSLGSPLGEKGKEKLAIFPRPYYMSKYPVTQEQYQAVIGKNPSFNTKEPMLPVECVSWHDAVAFCEKMTEIMHAQGFPKDSECRLPYETEWEHACRAMTTTLYNFKGGTDVWSHEYANADYHYKSTTPVNKFLPNFWGLHDMHGNVWEWCMDEYQAEMQMDAHLKHEKKNKKKKS